MHQDFSSTSTAIIFWTDLKTRSSTYPARDCVRDQWLWHRGLLRARDVGKRCWLSHSVRDHKVDQHELRRRLRCVVETAEDLLCVRVRPVVCDEAHDKHGGILDRLRREEIVGYGQEHDPGSDTGLMQEEQSHLCE
jgi:hypothetical protein